jgi:hypothetical protein
MAPLKSPSTRGFRAPRLILPPPRSVESVNGDGLSGRVGRDDGQMPPFVRWKDFIRNFIWRQGQHITIVGLTDSGKSTLAKELLRKRDFVIMLATKRLDPLYREFEQEGYVTVKSVDELVQKNKELKEGEKGRFIFKPPIKDVSKTALLDQAEEFRKVLVFIYQTGNWTVFSDEVRYLTDNLKLRAEFEVLWLQGRTLGIAIVALTQRPVSVPLLAFDQAYYQFIFRINHEDDIDTVARYSGSFKGDVRFTLPRLAKHDFLFIDLYHDQLFRSNVRT